MEPAHGGRWWGEAGEALDLEPDARPEPSLKAILPGGAFGQASPHEEDAPAHFPGPGIPPPILAECTQPVLITCPVPPNG